MRFMNGLLKNICVILIGIMLQSCLVASIGNNPRWNNIHPGAANAQGQHTATGKPEVHVEVLRDQRWIPFPLVIIAADKQNYGLNFNIKSTSNLYQTLDSITYQLYDAQNRLLTQGKALPRDSQIEKLEESKFYYQASGHTAYTLQLNKHLQENLSIKLVLHLQDTLGQPAAEEYLCALQMHIPKRIQVRFAGN